jgi:hypothetical protein
MKNRPSLEEIFSGSQQTDTQATVDNRPPLEEIFSSPQSDNSMIWGDNASTVGQQQIQQPEQNSAPSPVETVFNDMAKGYAESSIGFNQKLLAVNAILGLPILGKDEIQKRLTENVKYWEGVSSSMKYQDPNSWVWQMVGTAPLAGAEFAGTGAGVGSLALRGGALQALDEYGRKIAEENGERLTPGQFIGQFAQGAAITGTVGLAFKGAGGR